MNDEAIKAFFDKLDGLSTGDRAALRCEAGTMLKDAGGQAMRAFYQCLPYAVPQWQEEYFFAAACLRCLWDANEPDQADLVPAGYEMGRRRLYAYQAHKAHKAHQVQRLLRRLCGTPEGSRLLECGQSMGTAQVGAGDVRQAGRSKSC